MDGDVCGRGLGEHHNVRTCVRSFFFWRGAGGRGASCVHDLSNVFVTTRKCTATTYLRRGADEGCVGKCLCRSRQQTGTAACGRGVSRTEDKENAHGPLVPSSRAGGKSSTRPAPPPSPTQRRQNIRRCRWRRWANKSVDRIEQTHVTTALCCE